MITKILRTILYMNEAIDHVFFVTPGWKMYSSMKVELLINEQEMQEWYKSHYLAASRNVQIMSTHETKY